MFKMIPCAISLQCQVLRSCEVSHRLLPQCVSYRESVSRVGKKICFDYGGENKIFFNRLINTKVASALVPFMTRS